MKNFKFSIITAVYNSYNYLENTIESIINQSIGFKDNVQLILIDDGSTDDSKEILDKYKCMYPNNIIVLSKENGGPASARNLGLNYATGEYVNFLDSDDMLSENTLMDVYDFFLKFKDIDLVSIPLIFFDKEKKEHYLNYKFKKSPIIDLNRDIDCPQLSVSSSFIKKGAIETKFNENLIDGEGTVFIYEILFNKKKYGLVESASYYYRIRQDSSEYMYDLFSYKEAYTNKLILFYKYLIDLSLDKESKVLDCIQFLILLDLKRLIIAPEFKTVFEDINETERFWNSLDYILNYLDKKIILKHKFLDKQIKSFLIYLKNKNFKVDARPKKVFFKSNKYIISKLHEQKIYLDLIELKGNYLYVSGLLTTNCLKECIDIELIKVNQNGKKAKFQPKYVEYFDRKNDCYLGVDWNFKISFDFKIKFDENQLNRLFFIIHYDENGVHSKIKSKIEFNRYANLSYYGRYFVKDNKIVYFYENNLFIKPYSYKKMLVSELRDSYRIFAEYKSKFLIAISFRLIHLIFYPIMKNKRIWLFEDRVTTADDNAEHLFRYSVNQEDDIKKYYVISKDCDDFKRMSKINKNIVPYKSFKHKFLYLFSEKIISSHVDHSVLNPFIDDNLYVYKGLFTIQQCFLQHGITKDDMSNWIKKHYVNLFLFLTSSQLEYDSLFKNNYNYDDNVVQLFGLPRFDNLNNNAKKQIVFMPTWRNYIRSRELFKNSNHFQRINSFINNPKLIEYLKENDFQLIFKPHFEIFEHIDLFNIPKEVKVSSKDSYQTLFNESSILITDFSSVAFDFAYLKKPLIYYQEADDYHYSNTFFNYETMGLGDVVKSEEELVDKIIEYIENDCKINEKYLSRIEDFYKFTDKNNCKRVYTWLKENK